MEENKQEILDRLCFALQATRDQQDLKRLLYDEDHEEVIVCWEEGGTSVNVACDSGIAMIRDVLKAFG